MAYFDEKKNVEAYLKVAEGFDGGRLIAQLSELREERGKALELGMGGGKDLPLLKEAGWEPTGSDASEAFLERYREKDGRFPTLRLDAAKVETEESFDLIYSNKVLHLLKKEELGAALESHSRTLSPGGVLFHSFWFGDGAETYDGMHVQSYRPETLEEILPSGMKIIASEIYKEMEEGDSFWALLAQDPV